ncbi:AcrR family transcriptional regulator [Desulfitispora alkaliphila]|uniref:TetR family transcriptional regulator n=1 Tax=Desulfitispora alkaliphila TaxID=622674 RepID=UPI003D1B3576
MKDNRKEIQRERMYRYFIDATAEVIENEGIEKVSIRKIADKAGYTSSTVYNYFQEFSHLLYFAAMRFTKEYIDELPNYMNRGTNTVEKWLYSWECFCKHSFEKPQIYSIIFIDNLGIVPEDMLKDYYKIYEKDLMGLPKNLQDIVLQHTFSKRSALYLQQAIKEGFITSEDVDFISETTLLIWTGMMATFKNNRRKISPEKATEQTLYYVRESLMKVIAPEKKKDIRMQILL